MPTTLVRPASSLMLVFALAAPSSVVNGAQQPTADAAFGVTAPSPLTASGPDTAPRTQHVMVKSLSDGQSIRGSSATLKRRSDGIVVRVHTRALDAGESVDVFWAIFNHPEACANPNPLTGALCSPPDLFISATGGSLHYVATLTADAHGKLSSSASLAAGSSEGCVGDPFPCNTLTNTFGAEVHVPMFVPNGGPGRQAAQFLPLQAAQ